MVAAADHIQVLRNLVRVLVEHGGRASAATAAEVTIDSEIHIVGRGGVYIHADVRQTDEIGGRSARDGKPCPSSMQGINRGGIDRIGVANRDRLAAIQNSALSSQQQVIIESGRTLVVGEEVASEEIMLGALVPIYPADI